MKISDIIKGCKAQNLKAQRQLYEIYSGRLYPICLRYCKDQQSASAALQEAFLKIFRHINSIHDEDKLMAWMSKIAVRASIDQLKEDKRFLFVAVADEHFERTLNESESSLMDEKYLPLLDLMPEGYRLVFSMRVLEEMSHREIAQILGISENTSRSQLLKARKMLRKIIDQKYIPIF